MSLGRKIEPAWIKQLRSQSNMLNDLTNQGEATLHTPVSINIPLGDVNRLLAILDLAMSEEDDGGHNNAQIVNEAWLLATGAMEG